MKKFSDVFDKSVLTKSLTALLTAVFALGMIFYIAYHIADRFETDLTLLNAETKTVVRNISADAYIFRDETVLRTSGMVSGSITPAVHNGEKIAVGDRVADIYNYTSPDIENRIAEIDRQILLLEQTRSEDMSVLNTSGLDSEIYRGVENIRRNSENGSCGDALAYRAELLVSIKKKEILTGGVQNFNEQIRLLTEERASLTAQLGTRLESVSASSAGYYYAEVDGYEMLFRAEGLEGITYDGFMQLIEEEPANVAGAAGKVASDFRWYIACPMTKADSAYFAEGLRYDVTFPYNNKTLTMTLWSVIGEPGGSEAVAVFECRTLPYDFDYLRMQPVQICATDYTGFEIPVSAIRIVDGYEGVFVLDEVTVDFRRVNIVYEYDGTYLCTGGSLLPEEAETAAASEGTEGETAEPEGKKPPEYAWIRRNDIIITEGKDLYIGKVIG